MILVGTQSRLAWKEAKGRVFQFNLGPLRTRSWVPRHSNFTWSQMHTLLTRLFQMSGEYPFALITCNINPNQRFSNEPFLCNAWSWNSMLARYPLWPGNMVLGCELFIVSRNNICILLMAECCLPLLGKITRRGLFTPIRKQSEILL